MPRRKIDKSFAACEFAREVKNNAFTKFGLLLTVFLQNLVNSFTLHREAMYRTFSLVSKSASKRSVILLSLSKLHFSVHFLFNTRTVIFPPTSRINLPLLFSKLSPPFIIMPFPAGALFKRKTASCESISTPKLDFKSDPEFPTIAHVSNTLSFANSSSLKGNISELSSLKKPSYLSRILAQFIFV